MSARRSRRHTAIAVVAAVAMSVSACGRTGGTAEGGEDDGGGGERSEELTKADFAGLTDVCQPGDASGDTAQGVTGDEIQVGTMTDFGFTQVSEFIDAAEVFTKWCNDAGGINGRKLVSNTRDAKLTEYRQRVLQACREDFFLVGGGAAFDGSGVRDRLKCLLPEIPGQVVSAENGGADLQVDPIWYNRAVGQYAGYFRWLVKEGFPDSAGAVGIIAGDVGVTKTLAALYAETFEAVGAEVTYNEVYPPTGVSDWTPYAQAIKSDGVKGLVFLGEYEQLAKLEQALTDIGYTLTWVDANSSSYNRQFIELGGANLDRHTNVVDAGIYPLERASENEATQQLLDLFDKYKPDADVTRPVVIAWSAWLLFATAARDCGSELTRRCVYEKAKAQAEWDGAGLHTPTTLDDPDSRTVCFNIEKASSSGWEPVDISPNEGIYRCEEETYELKGDYGKAMTLADVGASLDDLE